MMRILYLEDNKADVEFTKIELRKSFPESTIDIAVSIAQAKQTIEQNPNYDIAILDLNLPDGNGLEFLSFIRQQNLPVAVVILTGSGNEELAIAALKAGANDYLSKNFDYLKELPTTIRFAIDNFKSSFIKHSKTYNVLYIEWHDSDIEFTIRHLKKYAPHIHVQIVSDANEAIEILKNQSSQVNTFDALLMDYHLPGLNAFDTIKKIKQELKLPMAIVLVTGQGSEEVAVEALKLGADDYLVKRDNYLFRLPSMLMNAFHKYELERQQVALSESESKYKLLADNSGDVIFMIDLDLKYTYVSPAVKLLRGFDASEVMKQNMEDVLAPDSLKIVTQFISRVFSSDSLPHVYPVEAQVLELEMIRKDGTTVWTEVKASIVYDCDNKPNGILGVTRDISMRKKATAELHKLSQAIEQSPTAVLLTNVEGEIEYINPKFTQFTGYSFEEVKGKKTSILKSGKNLKKVYSELWATILAGKEWFGEFQNKRKDGSLYWVNASISPVKDLNGLTTHYLAIEENITEKKNMILDLVQAKEHAEESDRLKTSFLQNISHEIRTPLNSIVGFSELICDSELDQDSKQYFYELITQSSSQLLAIITDIINISTYEAGQEKINRSQTNINEICSNISEQFHIAAGKKNVSIQLKTALPDDEAIITTDKSKLFQALANLVGNALKFTFEGHVEFGYVVKGNELEFYVEDTGIGIPIENQESIFKRFRQLEDNSTRKYGGSGLGLSISKAYVELLGGKIWVKSESGKGSTFYFTIPYYK